jgi:hypothetical protein
MKQQKHIERIPDSVLEQLRSMISASIELIIPYAVPLTPSERMTIPKMGEKSLGFVEKSYDYADNNRNFVPPFLDLNLFRVDLADAHGMWGIQNLAKQLKEMLNDTVMAAGSEAYQASLVFYSTVKVAAAHDVPGARAVYEALKVRFPSSRRKKSHTETVTETETFTEEIKVSEK